MVKYQFTKVFTKGNLAGINHYETMTFVNHIQADKWLKAINQVKTINYVIKDFIPQK